MSNEEKRIVFDKQLEIEAYQFKGLMQKFPNHFHDYYVIGIVENGQRKLSCKNKTYIIDKGDVILLNPFDNHACQQIDGKSLDWRCINIKVNTMKKIDTYTVNAGLLPTFKQPVINDHDVAYRFKSLHTAILSGQGTLEKEEAFYSLLGDLITDYSEIIKAETVNNVIELEPVCTYIEKNYEHSITLEELTQQCGLNKYNLIRLFTKKMGITPYQYLSTIRINHGKELLENGESPLNTALASDFSDQSHFTRFFLKFYWTNSQCLSAFLFF